MTREYDKKMDTWPFCEKTLTPTIPEDLLSLLVGGMSDALRAPVALMSCLPEESTATNCFHNFIFPKRYEGNEKKSIDEYFYPPICTFFREKFEIAKECCEDDSARRGCKILEGCVEEPCDEYRLLYDGKSYVQKSKCHLGLTLYIATISYCGKNLAVCTSGKFILKDKEGIVIENIRKYKGVKIEQDTIDKLLESSKTQEEAELLKKHFVAEMQTLNQMVAQYFNTKRREGEHSYQEKILKKLSNLPNTPDEFSAALSKILEEMKLTLGVKYFALFFAAKSDDDSLPLIAHTKIFSEDGKKEIDISAVSVNWRKMGLPPKDSTIEVAESDYTASTTKGVRGEGKKILFDALDVIHYGKEFRGVLLIGDFKETLSKEDKIECLRFINSLSHILMVHALAKRAVTISQQLDERRDTIVALTAHSIKHSLHTFFDHFSRVRHYTKDSAHYAKIANIWDKMEETIRIMKKNVDLAMAAPDTALIPELTSYEMQIEFINLLALLENCAEEVQMRAISKQIHFKFEDSVEILPQIQGDYYMLRLLLSNLLDNAIKYSQGSRHVRIFANKENISGNQCVVISIENVGFDIPETDREKIFEAHYKSKDTEDKKKNPQGVGLGLFQSQHFAKLHNGIIKVKSNDFSEFYKLITFSIILPIHYERRK